MGVSRSRSQWRTRRKGFPLVHHLPQRTKQRGLERGAGRSRQPQQCPEGHGHGESGRDGCREVGGTALTIVEFGDRGLLSPSPGDR